VSVQSRTNAAVAYSGVGPIELGRFGVQYFAGQMDEIRVWKTARTGAQIRSKMNKRLLGVPATSSNEGSEAGLTMLYRCDEFAGRLANSCQSTAGHFTGFLFTGVSYQ